MTNLEKYLYQLRRIEEHREKKAEKEIRKIYKELLKELNGFLGNIYATYSEDDMLNYADLAKAGMDARFLEEVEQRINGISPKVSKEIQETVQQTYEACYDGMRNAVVKAAGNRELLQQAFATVQACTPEVIRAAVNNPVSGLTLKDTLEKHRREIIYDIKKNIGVGLRNGDRYSTMARRIAESLDGDYKKAVRIVRTEAHRVRETGFNDAATAIDETLKKGTSGYVMAKTWHTMQDERVRPQKQKRKKYNHVKMDGVTIPQNELFKLPSGATCKAPSQTGVAGEDINCRCYLSYDLVLASELTKVQDGKKTIEEAVQATEEKTADKNYNDIQEINAEATENLLKAYDDRRQHYNMNLAPAKELKESGMNPVTANYDGISIQTATAFNDTISRLSNEYYTALTRIEVGDPKEFFGASVFASTRHNNTIAQKTLVINPIKMKDYDKFTERIKALSKKGWCVDIAEDKAGAYVAAHEFAHTLFDIGGGSLKNYVNLDTKHILKARKEIEVVYKEYIDNVKELELKVIAAKKHNAFTDFSASENELMAAFNELSKAQKELKAIKISEYSTESADEFMAEAFTQAKIGKNTSDYAAKVMQIIDKYFKK